MQRRRLYGVRPQRVRGTLPFCNRADADAIHSTYPAEYQLEPLFFGNVTKLK